MLLFCEYDSYFYIIHYISKEEFQHIDFFIQPIFHFLKKIFFIFFIFCVYYIKEEFEHISFFAIIQLFQLYPHYFSKNYHNGLKSIFD